MFNANHGLTPKDSVSFQDDAISFRNSNKQLVQVVSSQVSSKKQSFGIKQSFDMMEGRPPMNQTQPVMNVNGKKGKQASHLRTRDRITEQNKTQKTHTFGEASASKYSDVTRPIIQGEPNATQYAVFNTDTILVQQNLNVKDRKPSQPGRRTENTTMNKRFARDKSFSRSYQK